MVESCALPEHIGSRGLPPRQYRPRGKGEESMERGGALVECDSAVIDEDEEFCDDLLNNELRGVSQERWARYDSPMGVVSQNQRMRHVADSRETTNDDLVPSMLQRDTSISTDEYEDREEVNEQSVHRDAMGHILHTVRQKLGIPLLAVVDFQREVVYLKTSSGMFVSARPRLLSFSDWIMNLHHSMGLSNKTHVEEMCTVVEDTHCHLALGFSQFVVGSPRIRYVIGHPVFSPCRKDDAVCHGRSFIGFMYAMDRVSRTVDDLCLDSMTSFARVIGGILGQGTSWNNVRNRSPRMQRLECAFLHASMPLMIVKKHTNGEMVVEVYNNAVSSQFGHKGMSAGSNHMPFKKRRDDGQIRTVALWKHHEEYLSMEERMLVELCVELIFSSSFGLDKDQYGQYYMVYTSMQQASRIPQQKAVNTKSPYWDVLDDDSIMAKFDGHHASLEIFKCMGGSTSAKVVHAITSLDHPNILQKIRSGSVAETTDRVNEYWILQETPNMGTLHELILSGAFSGSCKECMVALSALDIARGIKHIHDNLLVYGDLNTRNIYVQTDPDDEYRGWRLVLGIPDVFDNLHVLDPKHKDMYTIKSSPLLSPCPEKCLGGTASRRTDLYSFGMILWEMWEASDAWPQMHDENQLIDKFCFEKDSISKYRYGMPEPICTIFSMCIDQNGHSNITNEKIITLFEDYVMMLTN